MTSSMFSRRKRVQPTPAICRRPPIPEPPDQPIDTLRGWIEIDSRPIVPPPHRIALPLKLTWLGTTSPQLFWQLLTTADIGLTLILEMPAAGRPTLFSFFLNISGFPGGNGSREIEMPDARHPPRGIFTDATHSSEIERILFQIMS